MTYTIETSDPVVRRIVRHQKTQANNHHGAVMNVVQRRYRLAKGASIHVSTSYVAPERDYAQGRYWVFYGDAPRPAHTGSFICHRVHDIKEA